MKILTTVLVSAMALSIASCSSSKNAPILFGQGTIIGLTVGAGLAEGPVPSITLGYKAFEIASVPTLDNNGELMGGVIPLGTEPDSPVATNAYSVFGSQGANVEADASTGIDMSIMLTRFISTGLAADKLADGVACRESRATDSRCTGTGNWIGN